MPYVRPQIREHIRGWLWDNNNPTVSMPATNAGELNFLLTEIICAYTQENDLSYQTINDVVGALQGTQNEYQRRVVGPYENLKISENGDVYPPDLISPYNV